MQLWEIQGLERQLWEIQGLEMQLWEIQGPGRVGSGSLEPVSDDSSPGREVLGTQELSSVGLEPRN